MMVDDPFIRPAIFFWKGGLWGAVLKFPWDMEMDDPNLKILHSSSKWPLVYSGTSTEFGPITKDQWNFLLNWIVENKTPVFKSWINKSNWSFFWDENSSFFPSSAPKSPLESSNSKTAPPKEMPIFSKTQALILLYIYAKVSYKCNS